MRLALRGRNWQLDGEGGALAFAVARRADLAAVQLRELPHQRETDAEPTILAGRGGVSLAEALEHVGQEVRRNSLARVADADLQVLFRPQKRQLDPPTLGVNFAAFDSRFPTICCSRAGSPWTRSLSGSMEQEISMVRASAEGFTSSTAHG